MSERCTGSVHHVVCELLCLYLCIYGCDVLSCFGVLLIISESTRVYAQLTVELNRSSDDRALGSYDGSDPSGASFLPIFVSESWSSVWYHPYLTSLHQSVIYHSAHGTNDLHEDGQLKNRNPLFRERGCGRCGVGFFSNFFGLNSFPQNEPFDDRDIRPYARSDRDVPLFLI